MKKLTIVTGHYGSGKTEFSINYALKLKEKFGKATICDMDIVNPYFRTNDAKEFLTKNGIKVIAPDYAGTNLDLPTLPSDIISVFADKDAPALFDVGGDEDGAIALGRYFPYIKDTDYEMFLVVNTKRPDTQSAEDIVSLAREIEISSRLKITALVNNPNLSYLSGPDDFKGSFEILNEVSKIMNVPVKYVSGREDILEKIDTDIEKFPMKLFMQLPFDALA